jgi:hypothetical protein
MQLVSSPTSQRSVIPKIAKQSIRLAHKLAVTLNDFRLGVREGAYVMSRYEALARLSDYALAKRGLTRDQIVRAALDECRTRR